MTTTLARRDMIAGEARQRSGFLPAEGDRRLPKIREAVELIQQELARLAMLERHEQQRALARAEAREVSAKALRKFEHRQAAKHLKISVDREFFFEIGTLALSTQTGAAFAALQEQLNQVWEKE